MKFGKVGMIGKVTLVSAIALSVATLFTACATLNVGFLFVTTTKQTPGQVEVYEVDSQSGSLRTIPTSPFPSGGRNPVSEAVSPDYKNLYVVNQDDNNVVQFGIGTDGKLYPQSTVNTPGAFPLGAAVNTAGTYFYGLDTLQPIAGCSPTNACPGDLFVCPISKTGALGTPTGDTSLCTDYYPLQLKSTDTTTVLTPSALSFTPNGQFIYVTAYNSATSPNAGYLFAFSVNGDGTLSPITLGSGGQIPLTLGTQPVALASDPNNGYLYIVDKLKNQVATYTIQTDGTVTKSSVASTGNQPSALTVIGGNFVYVTNSLDSTISAFTASNGVLTPLSNATYATDTNPVAVIGDPRKLGFLYTVNFLGSSLSGYKIDANSGQLVNTQRGPYLSTVQPTAIVGIPHNGNTH